MSESHEEVIRCPKCGIVQRAKVEHTEPFWTYVHECQCGEWIIESEWEPVVEARPEPDDTEPREDMPGDDERGAREYEAMVKARGGPK